MNIRIALAGNPNSGKTTLFNALTGSNQFVGNWPGVTVEKKEGKLKNHSNVIVTDLPGIYSLSPYTLEEVLARNYLIQERPDVILNIVDGTNLERNLYLTTQLTELGIPVVIAINMMDVVRKNGDHINTEELARQLGCKIVEISALRGDGIAEAAKVAIEAASGARTIPMHTFSGIVEHTLAHIEEAAVHEMPEEQQRWYAIKIFERDEKVMQKLNIAEDVRAHIESDIESTEKELDDDSESIITNERYLYIARILKASYRKKSAGKMTASDKIDRIVTNRVLALPIFALVMTAVYWIAMGPLGTFVTDWTNDVLGAEWMTEGARSLMESIGAADWLTGLVADGIVAGVGAVLGFVPQMLILFLFLCILEDVGYMARIAFIMDRIFRKFGLSGKSFIPMLIGTGCSVPGIMASRTIENERDRRMTIITTSFMPCSAKLPIIGLIAGAFFGENGFIAVSAYFIGVAAIVLSGIILKKTKMFAGEPAPFVMELPAYHMPLASNVLRGTWERGWSFIKRAGTVILLSAIVIWALSSLGSVNGKFGMVEELYEDESVVTESYLAGLAEKRGVSEDEIAPMDDSLLAEVGSVIAPVFKPVGFGSWKAAVATITGLVAKEEVVSTFGVLYNHSDEDGELGDNGEGIWGRVAMDYTPLSAFSFLVFNLLCAPCFAAIGAIKREMNNRKWTWFAIAYQTGIAYAVSFMVYQIGMFFSGEADIAGLTVALVLLAGALYLLLRPYKEATVLSKDVSIS
ncbi:MAG TPA: ferrous iron transport protein B [Bacillota bacterium]|nr:ferrous iron transport protein B [Bacillota bacterium]